MTNLMYAPSDKLTPRSQLHMIPTPRPMGRHHNPYPFHAYVDQVEESLRFHGFDIVDQEYVVTKDNQQFFGMMEIRGQGWHHNIIEDKGWNIQVGLRGSHNQTLPRGLLLGSQVIVCSNLCFHGNIGQFKTKQTTAISSRLPFLIRQCLTHVPEMIDEQDRVFDRMKEVELRKQDADEALVDLYRRKAFSSPQLTTAINEWDKPSFDHGPDHNVWRLFNAATQALKPGGENVNMALVEHRSQIISDYCTRLAA